MDSKVFNQGLLDFLAASPTPFHAVESMLKIFTEHDFKHLKEQDAWNLEPGKYVVTRNDSSIIAFVLASDKNDVIARSGIRMVGAHTDSPALRVKPNPDIEKKGYLNLGVEVYGGVLLNPWFDRDLSLAGRVTYTDDTQTICSTLINFETPIASIPSLAIHLDREANSSKTVNPQTDLPPLLMKQSKTSTLKTFNQVLQRQLKQSKDISSDKILGYELSFYDTQKPAIVGLEQEFINSARLDNLLSCYVGMKALVESDGSQFCLLVCNDHEEVGSASAEGAEGPFLKSVLERTIPDAETRFRAIAASMLISTDNAHGIHPNFSDKHDANHGPILNEGPVIKINTNQRYATNSETAGFYRHLCEKNNIPCQTFVVRTDMGCGSTIGPITAKEIGVKTIDVGVPTFAMHSIREMAGTEDALHLNLSLKAFYNYTGTI
ncbi:MAG: M18 family aminopeptidase [Pseudomonadales bacterium]|jgi:aspartyl aminopeptidase|tara:strand:+ start:2736 stop:4040 length:1305 start_codon:yes stop_codon:yes gene_type:complete